MFELISSSLQAEGHQKNEGEIQKKIGSRKNRLIESFDESLAKPRAGKT